MEKILFICIENSCRSQMAEGFAKIFGKGIFEAYSAGSKPSGEINPSAIEVMKKSGIDISSQRSKGFKDVEGVIFDTVVTLGCSDVCPFVSAKKHIEWKIDDPKGQGIDVFERVRDAIKEKVKELSRSIDNRRRR